MKLNRVLPVIIILITLSVAGIIFMQGAWMRNAIEAQRKQYDQALKGAVLKSRDEIVSLAITKLNPGYIPDERNKRRLLDLNFSATLFDEYEMRELIDHALRSYDLDQPFEFAIADFNEEMLLTSHGWTREDLFRSKHVWLTSYRAERPQQLLIAVQVPPNYFVSDMGWMIVASLVLIIIVIAAFALTVRTLVSQRKLNEIKSDFINNMTHELKTPLATISLATDSLLNPKVIGNEDQIRFYSGMIKAENKRMNEQVETILQSARIERNEVQLKLIEVDANEVIENAAETARLGIEEKGGTLTLSLNAHKSKVMVDQVHFSNIIFNLLDNATKYSNGEPKIDIITRNVGNKIQIRVRDQGIGMDRETLSRVFEKFYRAHTGNLHNVKGFGLGLSYVKSLTEAMKGTVSAESQPGKGSTFTITLAAK